MKTLNEALQRIEQLESETSKHAEAFAGATQAVKQLQEANQELQLQLEAANAATMQAEQKAIDTIASIGAAPVPIIIGQDEQMSIVETYDKLPIEKRSEYLQKNYNQFWAELRKK